MITEDYVSFEISKLLKKKGFDLGCDMYYTKTGSIAYTQLKFNHNEVENRYSRPTLQMAMKWLREVYNIFIQVELYKYDDYCFEVFQNAHRLIVEKDEVYNSYEQAEMDAIKYALENLI